MSDAQVVLLAGGMGKRLGIDAPKCLLKVSDNGKGNVTLLDLCMDKLIRNGFREFVMLLGYKAELVIKHIHASYGSSNISIRYSVDPEGRVGWGKGKAFKHALLNKSIDSSKRSLVTFPDDVILDDLIYSRFMDAHIRNVSSCSYATIALVNGVEYPYGVAELDEDGRIAVFKEKPVLNIPTSIGLYAFEPEVYNIIEEVVDLDKDESIELESVVFPKLVEMKKLSSFILDYKYWLPINTLKEYEKALKVLSR